MKTESALSLAELERLESICKRHETATTDEDRDIEKLVDGITGISRAHFVRELLWQDLERRQRLGEPIVVSDYSLSKPEDKQILNEVFEELKKDRAFVGLAHSTVQQAEELPARYKRIDEIGRGGVGSVWRVEDRHSQRTLAVKTLRTKFRTDRQANARLSREAILTGLLQHPGVPPVHDHGLLQDGSAFFVMKLIEGQTLEEILSRRGADKPNLQETLPVFEKVVQTMAFVHANDVIHRDLKPLNIMVGKFAEVQVMDWGMAKQLNDDKGRSVQQQRRQSRPHPPAESDAATREVSAAETVVFVDEGPVDLTGLTRSGDVLGTPRYMAPEQARGDIDELDARTDVYALGSILFEILTGSRMYPDSPASEILSQVVVADQAAAMATLDQCKADAALIDLCRRCLSFSPQERPSHAGMIASELSQHFVNNEKRIKAAEIDLREAKVRVDEEAKRRKTLVTMSLLILGVFAVGLAGVIWQWSNAVAAEARAVKNAEDSKQAAQLAKFNEDNFRAGLMVFSRAFQSTNTLRSEEASLTARDVLDQATEGLALTTLKGEGMYVMMREISNAYSGIGATENAIEVAERLTQFCEQEYGESAPRTLETMTDLGFMYRDAGRYADSVDVLEKTLKAQEVSVGKHHHHTLDTLSQLGIGYKKLGRFDEALDVQMRVLKIQELTPETTVRDRLRTITNIGDLHMELGEFKESAIYYEEALDLKIVEFGKDDNDTLLSMNSLANLYQQMGRDGDALALFENSLESQQERLGNQHPRTLIAMNNLAGIYQKVGRLNEAAELFDKAIAGGKKTFGPKHPNIVAMMNNQAALLERLERHDEAIELIEGAMEIFIGGLGDAHPNLCYLMDGLARNHHALGNQEPSRSWFEKSLRLSTEKLGKEHPRTLTTMHGLANTLVSLDEFTKAADLLESVVEFRESKLGAQHPDTKKAIEDLAHCRSLASNQANESGQGK